MHTKSYSLGLIGYPLGHSLSPQIHEAALHALGINGAYELYPVDPDHQPLTRESQLTLQVKADEPLTIDNLLGQIRAGIIDGLNVTIPHKQNVIPHLDVLTPAAETIGAVNTIFLKGNQLIGDNTDAPGFWRDLQRLEMPADQRKRSALILGAGGSARAVVYALLNQGYQVSITARRIVQAQALCKQMSVISEQLHILDPAHGTPSTDHYTLLVNTTPVGMHPHENESPWPVEIPLPKQASVYDLVYNPSETLLVKRARKAGLLASTGLGMLIEQAALAFECWTGLAAPRDVMMEAVSG